MAVFNQKNFADYLLGKKLITKAALKVAVKYAEKNLVNLETALVKTKIMTADSVYSAKADVFQIPRAELNTIEPTEICLELIPLEFSAAKKIAIFAKEENILSLAMADIEDLETQELVKRKTNLGLKIFYAPASEINSYLRKCMRLSQESAAPVSMKAKMNETAKIGEEDRLISLIDSIIEEAVKINASDIHMEPLEDGVLIRYRVNGDLQDIRKLDKLFKEAVVARIKVLANLKLDEHRLPQDGRFKKRISNLSYAFRVSIMPVFDGEKVNLRILQEEGRMYSIDPESFGQEGVDILIKNIKKPHGMILVTGPTGSGKTTILYTLLQIINRREVNIVTVEDPIEYRVPNVNQTQVRPEIGLTFASGLRSILRQDPNIIMVGEIRDRETAELAINAALTGHLVLSTLHTNTAAGALPRLLDLGVERFLIASTVNAVVGLRLVKTLGATNKTQYNLSHQEINSLRKDFNLDIDGISKVLLDAGIIRAGMDLTNVPFYKPQKTVDFPTGYVRRMAIGEIMEMNDQINSLIYKGASADEIEIIARRNGMKTLRERGFIAAAKGFTSIEEILRVTED